MAGAIVLALTLVCTLIQPALAIDAGDDVYYATVSGTLQYDYAHQVAALTNQQRAANGEASLQLDPTLTQRAMLRAQEISRIFEHTRPSGESCFTVLEDTVFANSSRGENIAMGSGAFYSPSMVMNSWMNSSGHRANILKDEFQSIGVGAAIDAETGYIYYVQLFSSLPASGGSVPSGSVSYDSLVEGSTDCPYYDELSGPTYLCALYPVFDADYYLSHNPDVAASFGSWNHGAAAAHFLSYGMDEGRRGSEAFDVFSYKNEYGDLRAAFGSDLASYYAHYLNYGRAEGRHGTGCSSLRGAVTGLNGVDYSAVYNYNYYLSHNPDVAAAFGSDDVAVLRHFVQYGMAEGRQGCEGFSVRSYRNEYADLRAAFGSNLSSYYLHYVNYGRAEGRHGTGCSSLRGAVTGLNGVDYSPVYNYSYYLSHNPDVAAAFGSDDVAVLRHFVQYGMAEGRQGCEGFSARTYRSRYGDLQAAYGNDLRQYYLHYLNFGRTEGRSGK